MREKINIKSDDPRKADIVTALKQKSQGTKVTNLVHLFPDTYGTPTFQGDCLRKATGGRGGTWEKLGSFQVTMHIKYSQADTYRATNAHVRGA